MGGDVFAARYLFCHAEPLSVLPNVSDASVQLRRLGDAIISPSSNSRTFPVEVLGISSWETNTTGAAP